MLIVPISIKYILKEDVSILDAYDAGVALSGISRSLAISIHYFVNQVVIKQAPYLDGAKISLKPPREGSFVFDVDIQILAATIYGIAAPAIIGNASWDFLKYIYTRTVGKEYAPTTSLTNTLIQNDAGAVDAIIDTIEGDVASVHRPIIHNVQNVFIISGNNNIVSLDRQTYDYVKAKNISDETRTFIGNVSSFNANSGRGRVYLSDYTRTVPFSPEEDEFDDSQKSLLAWSLNEYVNGNRGLLYIEASYISTPNGFLKSLVVRNIEKISRS